MKYNYYISDAPESQELIQIEKLNQPLYLASPYSHEDPIAREERWLDVSRAAAWLMAQGHTVISPVSMGHPISIMGESFKISHDFAAWQSICLHLLDSSKSLVVLRLDAWQQSIGVQAEIAHAQCMGLPIYSLIPDGDTYQIFPFTKE